MGNTMSGHRIEHKSASVRNYVDLGWEDVGTNGSAVFFVEQLIAGWSVAKGVDVKEAKKARSWFSYFGEKRDLRLSSLQNKKWMIEALQDTTDDRSWVKGSYLFGGVPTIGRVHLDRVKNKELKALLQLWHVTHTLYETCAQIMVTSDLITATLRAVESLESYKAAWDTKCRRLYTLMRRVHENRGYLTLG